MTGVTLAEVIPEHLWQMFRDALAQRPGVELDVHALWKKFRDKNPAIASNTELHFKWKHWCRTERPAMKTNPTPPPAPSTPARSNPEPATATGPGVRSASIDPVERSLRVERELADKRARDSAAAARDFAASGVKKLVAAQGDAWSSPEALEAARARRRAS